MDVSRRSGFTLIELLVVFAIIGIVSGIVYASLGGAREEAKMAAAIKMAQQVDSAISLYYRDTGELPPPCNNSSGCDDTSDPLLNSLGVSGWNGPYHSGLADLKHGWGGHIGIVTNNCTGSGPYDEVYVLLDEDAPGAGTGDDSAKIPSHILKKIDEKLDDGDLSSGRVIGDGKITSGCPTGARGEIVIRVSL